MSRGIPSKTEAIVLHLLSSHGELYGLQLVSLSDGALKRGTVYVTLGRMIDKGYVQARTDAAPAGHAGMPRPRYRATSFGLRALRAHQTVQSLLGSDTPEEA